MGAVSEFFDFLANGADLFFAGLRLHDDEHKFTLRVFRVGTAVSAVRSSEGRLPHPGCRKSRNISLPFRVAAPQMKQSKVNPVNERRKHPTKRLLTIQFEIPQESSS
jgi:hypothetical protein